MSTTVPTAAKQGFDPHQRRDLEASYAGLKNNPKMMASVGKLLQEKYAARGGAGYPAFLRLPKNATPEQAAEAFVKHAQSNIEALYDAQNPDYRERSKEWYQGANKMSKDFAKEYKVSERTAAGVIAALSPQRDWDQNVVMARRVLDEVVKNKDVPFSGERFTKTRDRMLEYAGEKLEANDKLEKKLAANPDMKPSAAAGIRKSINNNWKTAADLRELSNNLVGEAQRNILSRGIKPPRWAKSGA